MRNIDNLFKKRKVDEKKLIKYGFKKEKDTFFFEKEILNGSFIVQIKISEKAKTSKVIEKDLQEEYVLVDVEDAVGEFVRKSSI